MNIFQNISGAFLLLLSIFRYKKKIARITDIIHLMNHIPDTISSSKVNNMC
jgi:hypothetical protein